MVFTDILHYMRFLKYGISLSRIDAGLLIAYPHFLRNLSSNCGRWVKAHLNANQSYYDEGIRILELANKAYSLYLRQNHQERAKLLRTVLSNCSLKDGNLYPVYKKPFDMIAKGIDFENWRPQRDLNPCYRLERAMS